MSFSITFFCALNMIDWNLVIFWLKCNTFPWYHYGSMAYNKKLFYGRKLPVGNNDANLVIGPRMRYRLTAAIISTPYGLISSLILWRPNFQTHNENLFLGIELMPQTGRNHSLFTIIVWTIMYLLYLQFGIGQNLLDYRFMIPALSNNIGDWKYLSKLFFKI